MARNNRGKGSRGGKTPRKKLNILERMFFKAKTPAGMLLVGLAVLSPFLIGGKFRQTVENGANKIKQTVGKKDK